MKFKWNPGEVLMNLDEIYIEIGKFRRFLASHPGVLPWFYKGLVMDFG